jgi:hypothetical protein
VPPAIHSCEAIEALEEHDARLIRIGEVAALHRLIAAPGRSVTALAREYPQRGVNSAGASTTSDSTRPSGLRRHARHPAS